MLEKSHLLSVMTLVLLLLHFKFLSVLLSQAISERAAEMLSLTVWPWHFALTFLSVFHFFYLFNLFHFPKPSSAYQTYFLFRHYYFFLFQGVIGRYDTGKLISRVIINQLQLNPSFLIQSYWKKVQYYTHETLMKSTRFLV